MEVSPFRLLVRSGPDSGKTLSLPIEGVIRVGSARPSQLILPAKGLLPVHFFLKCAGGKVALIVQDENATVQLNGVAARKKILEPGDSIQAGEAQLVLESVQRDPLLGQTVGGYRIDALLGRGAMGTVYKATQLSLDRTVALKILSPELTRDAAFVAKFLEEAKAAAKLNHPHVVQIYDAAAARSPLAEGATADAPAGEAQIFFFSMENMPGGTLQKLLDKQAKLPLVRALSIGCDTARALVWAEEHGIVHRDIKPANLLFAGDGSVKVADLGIAADIDRMMEGAEGLQGAGSPRYMAPEQAQRKGVDHRADIYALGSTLFRAISGRHVFEGKSSAEVVKAKTSQDAPRLDSIAPEVSRDLADFIARMLSRELSGRPRTCAETLAALEEFHAAALDEAGDAAGGETAVPHAKSRAPVGRSKRRAHARSAGAGGSEGGWPAFIASTSGKVSLSVSTMVVLLALIWPMSSGNPVARPGGTTPVAAANKAGSPSAVPTTGRTRDTEGAALPVETVDAASSTAAPADASLLGDPALLRQLGSILQEYKTGLIDSKRAIAALEDFKRKHPEPVYAEKVDRFLGGLRDGLTEACKSALSRLLNGDVRALMDQGNYRDAVNRLVKLGEAHPLCQKEINAEVAKVEEAASTALKKADAESDKAAALGDFAGAVAVLKKIEGEMPASLQMGVTEKLTRLEKDQKEYAELSGPFTTQVEVVQDAIASLDFARAGTQASALPRPKNPLLASRRVAIVAEVELCRAVWERLRSASEKAGSKAEPGALLSSPAAELLALLGPSPSADQVEGLGLLLLETQGPDRAKDLLLSTRLSAPKIAAYKLRLAEEADSYLTRYARSLLARIAQAKSGGPGAKLDWARIAAEALQKIGASRAVSGYEKARSSLAKAYLQAKAEVFRETAPASLFKGKVKSYKSDGSIELVYEFLSEDELKDFIPARSLASRLELDGKAVKMKGEFRFCRGDVFRSRLGVSGKVAVDGYSATAPNINVAFWTRDDDRVSVRKKDGKPAREGFPRDYIAFAFGYRATLPAGSGEDALMVSGGSTAVPMPVNAVLGGLRGEPLHSNPEADCFWVKPTGKVSGAQAFRIAMAAGAITWTVNTRSMLAARDMKDLERLKRDEPFLGSLTFFTNGEVLVHDALYIEGELNPAWIEEQLIATAEIELRKVEPDYPFRN